MYGVNGPRPRRPTAGGRLARLVAARNRYAYGKQKDYFDQPDCIGWARAGHPSKSEGAGLAVILNSSWESRWKKMYVGQHRAGEKWTDLMGWAWGEVIIDDFGAGDFPVGPRGIGVWTSKAARGRDKIDRLVMEKIPFDEK
jgi:alpha-amylase